ncbi:MAG: hypothetical protein HKN87_17845 [Saprospiraceae bacterium]|nr:hypothetical protein [Saprospiraceae bacterium]
MLFPKYRITLLIIVFGALAVKISAQRLAGLSTKWDDSFSEWIIYGENEEFEGEITMRWQMRGDWTEWDFRIGELSGQIKTKWNNDANLWELRSDNQIITIRTVWKDDWRQWEIKNGDVRIDVKSNWSNILEEWSTTGDRHGTMQIFTAWEGELRDWVIEDDLDTEISIPTKIAMAFIPVFYATPKF